MVSTLKAQAVILAGGSGTRFWPISRTKRPKQFLSISQDNESLIAATARRLVPLVGKESVWVVTNIEHKGLVEEHVPFARIITEPVGRNTAASIGLAALHLRRQDPEQVMLLLPADHAVKDEAALRRTMERAIVTAAESSQLVTVGIPPTSPHTGYGYIKRGKPLSAGGFAVSRFYEKPNFERAKRYVESGDFLWNSGMFAWKVGVILDAIREFMPQLYEGLMRIDAVLHRPEEAATVTEVFAGLESISVDFGILEHARNCAVVAAEPFGWSDVGSWDAWAEHFTTDSNGNLLRGDTVIVDSKNCVVHSEKSLTAVIGAENLVIIDAGDALLVCPRGKVQEVRAVVEELKRRDRRDVM
ncbi:MAG: mannose-1-phosphate guanylyltransferase [Proteobacteria bacterium]|nr:mannose-1-phosphate guanylyltransferase [Pseudomonadota bacterium]